MIDLNTELLNANEINISSALRAQIAPPVSGGQALANQLNSLIPACTQSQTIADSIAQYSVVNDAIPGVMKSLEAKLII